ncbi:ferrioxamine B receptor [Vibrio sinaloensis DSM 21326]|uniref:Ferrioxamine B receptor n=1 Tax=Vibrio sinaloensis DSM 21326 TaxID=945550 RepID=E8M315_PHOS4|nr:TonB-dependent siderophore receptor [Vibrio sinaloensis]EGA71673.1 ferrioxamine B receptor [Vibrio sinaloensis DSM 21326]
MITPTRFNRSTLTLALLAALAAPAFAAEDTSEDSTLLETVTVLGKAYRNTATKTALKPEETPQGITVIDDQQLEQRGVQSLSEAVRYASGVVTETRGGAVTMFDTFMIRGFRAEQSYYDGLVLPLLNNWNLQPQIDPFAVQQIEVFKGPTSVLYGAMSPGGMVNMVAKSPQQEQSTKVGLATGSHSLKQVSLDTTGQFGDSDVSYRLLALARQKDSQVGGATEERYLIAPSIDWQVTDSTWVNFNLYYQKDPSMGINSALPSSGMFVDNPNGSTSPSTWIGADDWSTFEREVMMLGYKINHEFNANWSFLQNARYLDASLLQENTYHGAVYGPGGWDYNYWDPNTGNIRLLAYSTEEESKGFTIDNQLSGLIETGSIQHNILLGIDYQNLDGESVYTAFDKVYWNNVFNPSNDFINRNDMGNEYRNVDEVTVDQLGFYLQDQIRYNNLVLIAGGRYDHYRADNEYNGASTKADHRQFSYRVGALYEFESGIAPFISYATSFEPLAGTNALTGEDYDPELGKQIEAGVKYQSADGSQSLTTSLFQITKSDVLAADPNNFLQRIQIGEVVSKGVEVEGRWYATESLDLAASYTYLDMEVTDAGADQGLEGTTPIYVPTHSANLWANYQFYTGSLAGARFGGGVRYVGKMERDAYNLTGSVPSYTLVDMSFGYELGNAVESLDGTSVNVIANNLLNEEYYSCYDNDNCWYGAERSIELNVNYEF